MASLEEIRQTRLEKLERLKKEGINPYPAIVTRDATLAEIITQFESLEKEQKTVAIAGRIMSLRAQGGLIFFHLFDGTAKFQGLLKLEEIAEDQFKLFSETIDIGDFVEIHGTLFITKRGEKTLLVKEWKIITKSLRPLPEKWHGLQDVDERFRHRYLDILMSEEVKNRFATRSKIISSIREYLNKAGFLEVETPMLQSQAGGATAEPFKTHHNALDIDLYLRIAPELYLKKLLIAGFPKIYEINRNFRNEGIDMTHNPEFTMLEFYEAYSTAEKQRTFVEEMLRNLTQTIFNAPTITFQEQQIDFSKSFALTTYSALLEKANVKNGALATLEDAKAAAFQHKIKVEPSDTTEKILDSIYKKVIRPDLIQPVFIVDYPVNYLPLAKRSEKDNRVVDAFQLVVGGIELVKAFSELNDPIDQAARFAEQDKNKAAGDKEAQQSDMEFLEALEYGMPPAGGVGIGIDRLVMLLTNTRNIKEVIAFPTMRPKE